MSSPTVDLKDTHQFSKMFLDYMLGDEKLKPFYNLLPTPESFGEAIKNKSFSRTSRKKLTQTLRKQYKGLEITKTVEENIESLDQKNTFTITTGHQLNIFTGPLYCIYKIITIINTCKKLKEEYPHYSFVPVFWMASEDHDFEEINHVFYHRNRFTWNTSQQGAVGKFDPKECLEVMKEMNITTDAFKRAYEQSTLTDAVRHYINKLFGEYGLIILDANEKSLKNQLIPVIKEDVFDQTPKVLIEESLQKLKVLGYESQANARDINFFYLKDNVRERIEKVEGKFKIMNTDITFSPEDMITEIQNYPERFSPNVLLRPLYQEIILPNLAYIGGPSEINYWLQLKSTFDNFKIPFPVLMPRNFVMVLDKKHQRIMNQLAITNEDVFLSQSEILSKYVLKNSEQSLSLGTEKIDLEEVYGKIEKKATQVDSTLSVHIRALYAIAKKKIDIAEKKLVSAEKRKYSVQNSKIVFLKEDLFPEGSLQERHDNFLNYGVEGEEFIYTIQTTLDPFKFEMYFIQLS